MNTATPKFLLAAAAVVAGACFVSAAEPAPAEPPAAAPVAEAQGEMISGGDGTRLFLKRDLPEGDARAVLVIVHGLANHHGLYDDFVKPFGKAGIAVYRYDARGHGRSEGRRGYVKSYWEMVDDLRAVVALAKAERPGLPVYVLGHSMGGHVSALYGTKHPGEASGFILCAGVLRYHFMNFGWLPRPEDPEAEISPVDAAYGTLHLPGWKELSTFSTEGDGAPGQRPFPFHARVNALRPRPVRQKGDCLSAGPSVPSTSEAFRLSARLLAVHALPENSSTDALHVALAVVYGADILLTWNCRHIANPTTLPLTMKTIAESGYRCPAITTPALRLEDIHVDESHS